MVTKCSAVTFVGIYRDVVQNGGTWKDVSDRSGLTENTCRQKMASIRTAQLDILMKGGKTEDEAKAAVARVLPHFPRSASSSSEDTAAELNALLFPEKEEVDEVDEVEAEVDETVSA